MPTEHLASEVRRHQIVRSARKIVATHGMTFLTIQELAKEVGVSEGAIYRHFKSKDEILLVLIQDIEHNLLDTIAESARPEDGALDQLNQLLQHHFSSIERRNGVSFVVIAESLRFADSQVKQATRQMVESYLEMIDGILKTGVETGEIDEKVDTKAAALMFFAMIQASVTLWSFSNRAHPLAQHSASLWEIFKGGVTTPNSRNGQHLPGSSQGPSPAHADEWPD